MRQAMVDLTSLSTPESAHDPADAVPSSVDLRSNTCIYVVDDEPAVAELVAALLEIEGLGSTVFQSPLQALNAFRAANPRPKLLITDYRMHVLNGMELIEQCKLLEPELHTMLISGHASDDNVAAFAVRPEAFIRKPFRSIVLIAAVRSLLT
jgi:CheY-like chemotaxis protein